jgi:hypothetical protein
MRQESVGGSSGGALQTLLDKAAAVPASAQDRLVLMPQFLPWGKHDAAAVRIRRRNDMDSLSELRAHERSGRVMMRSWADRLDPDVPTTAKVVQEMTRDLGKARRERGLVALQFAEGLARQGAVLLPGQPVGKDFVELCKRAMFLLSYEQERTWLAFKVPREERRDLRAMEAAEQARAFTTWHSRNGAMQLSVKELRTAQRKHRQQVLEATHKALTKEAALPRPPKRPRWDRTQQPPRWAPRGPPRAPPPFGSTAIVPFGQRPRMLCTFCAQWQPNRAQSHTDDFCYAINPSRRPANYVVPTHIPAATLQAAIAARGAARGGVAPGGAVRPRAPRPQAPRPAMGPGPSAPRPRG